MLCATFGCAGSMGADARMTAELDAQEPAGLEKEPPPAESKQPLQEQPVTAEETARAQLAASPEPQVTFALLGARHDFSVRDASSALHCHCVGALLGPPSSGNLTWQGEMPRTKPEAQLMLALVPDANCAGASKDSGGASYWGYRIQGNDVVVLLEDWKEGRPRTLGAIIPKPPEGGQVYLAPRGKNVPFGLPMSGAGDRCALGNPGPKRNEPLIPDAAPPDADGDATAPEPARPSGRPHGRRHK